MGGRPGPGFSGHRGSNMAVPCRTPQLRDDALEASANGDGTCYNDSQHEQGHAHAGWYGQISKDCSEEGQKLVDNGGNENQTIHTALRGLVFLLLKTNTTDERFFVGQNQTSMVEPGLCNFHAIGYRKKLENRWSNLSTPSYFRLTY